MTAPISFEVRWNPDTDKWQYRAKPTEDRIPFWSEPMPLWKCQKAMKAEVAPLEDKPDHPWSKPIAHSKRRVRTMDDDVQRYEIRGGKVQRIPGSRTEKENQDLAELMSLLDD